jgi:adhesin transport system outer membrane protein
VLPNRVSFRLVATVVATLLVLLPASPAAAITLKEAVDRALARSPEVSGLTSQIEILRSRQEFAGHTGLPQVALDAGFGGEYSNLLGRGPAAQLRRDIGANLTQKLWDWQRTSHTVEAASRRAEASGIDVEMAREKLAFQTAEAYLNVLRRRLLLRQTQLNITYHRWLVDSARERVAKKQLAMARLTELEARLAPLTVERIEQEAELSRALITLQELSGETTDLTLPPEFKVDQRAVGDLDAFVADTLANHPAVKRSALLQEAANADYEAIRSGYYPQLDASLSTRYLDEAEGLRGLQWDNLAMVRVNWGLFGQGVPAQGHRSPSGPDAAGHHARFTSLRNHPTCGRRTGPHLGWLRNSR